MQHVHDRIMVYKYKKKELVGIIEVPGCVLEIQTIDKRIYISYTNNKSTYYNDENCMVFKSDCNPNTCSLTEETIIPRMATHLKLACILQNSRTKLIKIVNMLNTK